MAYFEALHVHLITKSCWMNKVKDSILPSASMATPVGELQLRQCSPWKSQIRLDKHMKVLRGFPVVLWERTPPLWSLAWSQRRSAMIRYLLHMSSNPCAGKSMRLDQMISHRGSKFVSSVCHERASCNSILSVSLYSEGQEWKKEWYRDKRPTVFFSKYH